ncbi:MAG: hypothetical protein IAX21_02830 [Candidatus Bathyarchaeota archaeon]|nr:MAG: hypothetical protein NUK63_02740 [Candidatus Bathyarchaeum tardum]WNZ29809.1 MAG: hypothetical protein IAX21_02830 [Candidatus Bathyarchaeota archaeon]
MTKDRSSRNNSGQSLIIAALVVSLLIISIFYSVFEANRTNESRASKTLNSHVSAVKLGLQNTVTSALVNASNGGSTQALITNLERYASFVGTQLHFGKCVTLFTVLDSLTYQSGIQLSWGSDGTGVSSAYANSTLYFVDAESELQLETVTNITTSVTLEGTYITLGETEKQVNVTCRLFNENESVLAKSIAIYYEYDGEPSDQNWIAANSPTVFDYGNGTYVISFIAVTQTRNDPVLVSAQIFDHRDVFVLANVTCTET